jgi:hypothetical protein
VAKSRVAKNPPTDNGEPVKRGPDPTDEKPGRTDLTIPTPDAAPDPFDPASLRISGAAAESIGVKRAILTVPVRKPGQEFVRVHPDEAFALPTTILELKADREIFLVSPSLRDALAAESAMSVRMLFTTISRQGDLFLWPVRLPAPTGRVDNWSVSAMEAAQLARKSWVRVQAKMSLGAYEVFEATGDLPAPEWPSLSFAEILKIAFKDRLIDALDHPVLRQLRGEV